VLYELLAGTLPYRRTPDVISDLFRRVNEDPVPLARAAPHVPLQLATVVDRSIARQPGERFDTAERFGEAVAVAASAAWGRGWLDGTGVPVLASGRMATALAHDTPVKPVARDDATRKVATTAKLPASADAVEDAAGSDVPKGPARARLRVLAVLTLVVLLGGIGVAVLLSGGGGGNASPPGSTGRPLPNPPVTASPASGVVPPPAGATTPGDVLGRKVVPVQTEPCKAPTTGEGAAWQLGAVQVKDRMFDTAYYCNIFPGGRGSLDFVLGGAYRQLAVTIGFADRLSSPSARATFEIVGDGKDYLTPTQTLTFGQVSTLAVDVAGVTRLTITVTEVGPPGGNQAASVPVLAGPTLSPPS
ncbi:MAG: NPCBM/NEW2 domain-containing protein, partial [Acidimicrobiales bacterium]